MITKQFELNHTLFDLSNQLIAYLESINMMGRTIQNYKSVLNKLLCFAAAKHEMFYSRGLLDKFINENGFQERALDPGHMYYRTCMMLHDLAQGVIPSHSYARHKTEIPLPLNWNTVIKNYRNSLYSKHQSSITIQTKLNRLKEFLKFSLESNIPTPEILTATTISNFICYVDHKYKPIYKYNLLQSLKDFLLFLHTSFSTQNNLTLLLPRMPDPKNSVLPIIYSPKEIQAILYSINRDNFIGKRDFAIVMMISQTGIRASDVANLKISDIDFTSHKVRFLQNKTTRFHQLPLTKTLFFSLCDYLSSRKNYKCPNLFIRTTNARVDVSITSSCISAIIRKYIRLSGIDKVGRKSGAHSLRHSLAISMMEDDTPFPVISTVLGHSSTEVTKKYAQICLKHLRILPLEVPVYEK